MKMSFKMLVNGKWRAAEGDVSDQVHNKLVGAEPFFAVQDSKGRWFISEDGAPGAKSIRALVEVGIDDEDMERASTLIQRLGVERAFDLLASAVDVELDLALEMRSNFDPEAVDEGVNFDREEYQNVLEKIRGLASALEKLTGLEGGEVSP